MATLTFVYADSTAVVGPLSAYVDPHSYDLCADHAQRLSVPVGWDLVRQLDEAGALGPSPDDLLALADAVREAARPETPAAPVKVQEVGRRGHLRVLKTME